MKPSTPDAFKLLMEGADAFADVEQNGMKIDVEYLDRILNDTEKKIRQLEVSLRSDEVFDTWQRHFGEKADLGSRTQLGTVIFDLLKVPCVRRTKTGRPATDAEAFEDVDYPFVKRYVDCEKLKKARGTFLMGIKNEVDSEGFLHPFLNLHLASTYRSSSDSPNLQNQPIRDPRQAKLIRRSFIPRSDDHVLLETDYSALEFRGAANFWHDPAMVSYASDPALDIHRDMAAECFNLTKDQVSKPARSTAKNAFVFPVLYGSTYRNCSKNLWSQIHRQELSTAAGVGLYEHLRSKGIHDQKAFELHIKGVEDRFNKRFPHWSSEKDVWWDLYLKRGWFPLSTGFVCHGVFSYNNLMNTPIQGPSFHCLLWSLIQINKWLKKYKMRSKIIVQIHDSILMDVHRKELDDVLIKVEEVMTRDVRKHWDWIVTPLAVETEWSETNWFEKKKYPG